MTRTDPFGSWEKLREPADEWIVHSHAQISSKAKNLELILPYYDICRTEQMNSSSGGFHFVASILMKMPESFTLFAKAAFWESLLPLPLP